MATYFFPNLIKLVQEKHIKLYLNGCKVVQTLAGKLCLVSLVYGTGYYGSFNKQTGQFFPNAQCKKEFLEQLASVEARGLDAVSEIGLLTGRCGICGRELTAEGSIAMGIGPICAGKSNWAGYSEAEAM